MKSESLDLLEKSQLPLVQARAILQVMDSELAAHDTALATKADLQVLRGDLQALRLGNQADLQALRAELIRWNFAFWVAQLGGLAAILKLLK